MANNVTQKGLQEITKTLQKSGLSGEALKQDEAHEIANNWKKLATFMGSRR